MDGELCDGLQDFLAGEVGLTDGLQHGLGREILVHVRKHRQILFRPHLRHASLLPEVVHSGIDGDAGQPMAEALGHAERVRTLHGTQEGVVRQILGHLAFRHIPIAYPDHLRDMPLVLPCPKSVRRIHTVYYLRVQK